MDFTAALKKRPAAEAEIVDDATLPQKTKPFDLEALKRGLAPYRADIEEIKSRALSHKVTDDQSNVMAVEMGSQAKKLFNEVDAKRKQVISPYDQIVRGINGMVKEFKDSLLSIERDLKSKIGRYQREQAELARRIAEKKAREEAEKRRLELEAERKAEYERQEKERQEALSRQKELEAQAKAADVEPVKVDVPDVDESLKDEVRAEDVIIDMPQASGPTKTEEGTASVIKRYKHRLINISVVPAEYLALDDAKVKKAISAGIRSIPGVEVYEDTEVRFRTK